MLGLDSRTQYVLSFQVFRSESLEPYRLEIDLRLNDGDDVVLAIKEAFEAHPKIAVLGLEKKTTEWIEL